MKKFYLSSYLLLSICFSCYQQPSIIKDKSFFISSEYWEVKDFYFTSSDENFKKSLSSSNKTFLDDDTLHLIKDYKFYEVPNESKIFKNMKVYFLDSSLKLKIEGYDNDDIKFPYSFENGNFKIDLSLIGESFKKVKMKISKKSTYNIVRFDWDYVLDGISLNYSIILSRIQ